MRYFPIFLDIAEQTVVIAGAGDAALQKARLVLKTQAKIRIFGTDPHPDLTAMARVGRLELFERLFQPSDLDGAAIAYGAHGKLELDRLVSEAARSRSIPVNVVDTPDLSTFITPAIVDRDPMVVAIGSEGSAPVLARMIKARIEALLPTDLGEMARVASGLRRHVAKYVLDGRARRRFWIRLFEIGFERGASSLGEESGAVLAEVPREERGRVWLVGAGPGDPELMTLKARRILDCADVIVHDRLVDPRVLEIARREACFIDVGKTPGIGSPWQEDINRILVNEARDGNFVVRLKGGDPLVFGRADEEIEALNAAGIQVDVVPGVTAASASAAAAGLSLTRRDRNSSISLITARDANGPSEHDWAALAKDGAAFAVYMGVGQARFLQGRLMLHGARLDLAVCVVENVARANEKIVHGNLGGLTSLIQSNQITGPAVILVGLSPDQANMQALELKCRGTA